MRNLCVSCEEGARKARGSYDNGASVARMSRESHEEVIEELTGIVCCLECDRLKSLSAELDVVAGGPYVKYIREREERMEVGKRVRLRVVEGYKRFLGLNRYEEGIC